MDLQKQLLCEQMQSTRPNRVWCRLATLAGSAQEEINLANRTLQTIITYKVANYE